MPVGGEQPGCKSHEYMLFLVLSLVVSIVVKLGGLEGPLLYSSSFHFVPVLNSIYLEALLQAD